MGPQVQNEMQVPKWPIGFEKLSSGKRVGEITTPLYPAFIKKNCGMQGYTYFSYFCSKT